MGDIMDRKSTDFEKEVIKILEWIVVLLLTIIVLLFIH